MDGFTDMRLCFLGDSFVAGVGDPEALGWVGRVSARSIGRGAALTAYNLGIRRDTSTDVLARAHDEVTRRLPADVDGRVVCSFGVNDTDIDDGALRVGPSVTITNFEKLIDRLRGRPLLFVGPPPVGDEGHNHRIEALDDALTSRAVRGAVPYLSIFAALVDSPVWRDEVAAGDGSHPGALGYETMADLIWRGGWCDWLGLE